MKYLLSILSFLIFSCSEQEGEGVIDSVKENKEFIEKQLEEGYEIK